MSTLPRIASTHTPAPLVAPERPQREDTGAPSNADAAREAERKPQRVASEPAATLVPSNVTPLPTEVHAEIAAASARFEELRSLGRELHFLVDEQTGRVVVEVRDLEGRLIRRVPPSVALDLASAPDLGLGGPRRT